SRLSSLPPAFPVRMTVQRADCLFIDHLNIPLYTSFYHVIITLLCLIFKRTEKEDGSENFVG
ncbi:TPA: hypothetical protein ACP4TR_004963, partial [Escherichia coli]